MSQVDRKAAVAAYKERKSPAGIFAVVCTASDQRWVGRARDLDAIWNRLSFSLRQGAGQNRAMQAAWIAHGADSFTFEALEQVSDELTPIGRDDELKRRLVHWRETLNAEAA